jgi:hypothetical protein
VRMETVQEVEEVMRKVVHDPTSHRLLCDIVSCLPELDPVDALQDLQYALELAKRRLCAVEAQNGWNSGILSITHED